MTPDEIREWRNRVGWSLDLLAGALGVDRMTVWRWEQPKDSKQHRAPAPYLRLALERLESG